MPRVEINVVEAQGLPAADLNGKADPYVEVCSAAGRQKTDIKKKTLSPVWNETKVVNIADMMHDAVGFLVWDWDRMSANEIIAYGSISMIGLPPNGAPLDYWVQLFKKTKKDGKKDKKAKVSKEAKAKPPGGRLHIVVRLLDVPPMAAAPMMPAQPMPGQPMMAPQPMPGQPMPGQPMPGQPMMAPQPMPGQPMMAPQPMPGQPMMAPGAPMMAAPMMAAPMVQPLLVPHPYTGVVPDGFHNKAGFLRPKRTGAEVAGQVAGKGAKKTLKGLVKILT